MSKTEGTTLEDILGTSIDISKPKKNKNDKQLFSDKNNEIEHLDIDTILNNKLVSFDNKWQTSMFFVAYKVLEAIDKELLDKYKFNLSKETVEGLIIKKIPLIIKNYNSNLRRRCKQTISSDLLCLGRKLDGTQCSRKKHTGNHFCKSHLKRLSNGRVDDPSSIVNNSRKYKDTTSNTNDNNDIVVYNADADADADTDTDTDTSTPTSSATTTTLNLTLTKEIKNSAITHVAGKRGRKPKSQFDPRQYDEQYVTLWEDIIDGEKVLVDTANNVYTFNMERPVYIGKKDVNINLNIKQFLAKLNESTIELDLKQ